MYIICPTRYLCVYMIKELLNQLILLFNEAFDISKALKHLYKQH